jgi:protein-disulfide isomerase
MKDLSIREQGNPKVTLLEFGDYECPYTQQAQAIVARLEAEFKGRIAFVYKDFPLPMHAHAEKAAEASHCAAEQGKYWELHDLMFATKQLDPDALKKDANELKLDTTAFNACLDNGKTADAVKAQLSEAQALGLQGAPSFFVNGRAVANSYDKIRAVIGEELSAPSDRTAAASVAPTAGKHPYAGARNQ